VAAGSSGPNAVGTRYDLGSAWSKWGLRCQVAGAATEVSVQLLGGVASSSDAIGTLVALTTWVLTAASCDEAVFVVDKSVTSVAAKLTTMGLSTGATVSAWITGG